MKDEILLREHEKLIHELEYIPGNVTDWKCSTTCKFELLKSLQVMLYLIIFTLYSYSTEEIAYIS